MSALTYPYTTILTVHHSGEEYLLHVNIGLFLKRYTVFMNSAQCTLQITSQSKVMDGEQQMSYDRGEKKEERE